MGGLLMCHLMQLVRLSLSRMIHQLHRLHAPRLHEKQPSLKRQQKLRNNLLPKRKQPPKRVPQPNQSQQQSFKSVKNLHRNLNSPASSYNYLGQLAHYINIQTYFSTNFVNIYFSLTYVPSLSFEIEIKFNSN